MKDALDSVSFVVLEIVAKSWIQIIESYFH